MTADQPSAGRPGNRAGEERRQAILDFHRSFVERHGYCPSIREVADAVGLKSTSTVSHHFTILEKEGRLTRGARMPRPARKFRLDVGSWPVGRVWCRHRVDHGGCP